MAAILGILNILNNIIFIGAISLLKIFGMNIANPLSVGGIKTRVTEGATYFIIYSS